MIQASLRRVLLSLLALGLFSLPRLAQADEKPMTKTFTYKTVGDCAIKADVYGADDQVRPVVIWVHGGALITGSREGMITTLHNALLKAGYVVVSIDYRLAPETKLPAILEDLEDACRWVRTKGPELFHVDTKKIAVVGGSAGGYLTLTAGYRVEPRPTVLVACWGYGDLIAPWYSKPDPFYVKQPLVAKEEAYKAVGGPVLSEPAKNAPRGRFYLYCRQTGLWPKEVVGHDPVTEPKAFDPFCPLRNVSKKYPPTLFIHGTKDTDVPYEQSVDMAKELERHGVAHELLTITDAGHGLSGAKPEVSAKAYAHAVEFINQYMR